MMNAILLQRFAKDSFSADVSVYMRNHKSVPFRMQFDNCEVSFIYTQLRFLYTTKTSPFNEDPLTPHFYIVKLGFTGVYIIFIFCSKT